MLHDFSWGLVHLFALDSDTQEPDGSKSTSAQAAWLKEELTGADEPWKIVYFHHPPFSSGHHESMNWMRWPFAQWEATAVLAGHDQVHYKASYGAMLVQATEQQITFQFINWQGEVINTYRIPAQAALQIGPPLRQGIPAKPGLPRTFQPIEDYP